MSALYIHVPFCKKECNYCDFYKKKMPSPGQMDAYVAALSKEMEYRRDFLKGSPINTIFFGGGTPSLYHPSALQQIIDEVRRVWGTDELEEVTVEVNPDDATEEYLEALAATGVNRISFGVQSFSDRDLALLGRRHNSQQAENAVRSAREKGFDNISIDLIFGVPGQSLKDLDRNIIKALSLKADHISAYHLTIEPGTAFAKMVDAGQMSQIEEADSETQYQFIHEVLTRAEFDHYEVSNYARKPEYRSRHNCSYWCGENYLGLGPSSHSYDGDQRIFAVSSFDDYMAGVGTDLIYGREILSKVDKYNEFVMVSLRTCCGVKRDVLTRNFGMDWLLYFEYAAEKFLQDGLLIKKDNEYKIPPEKFMMSDMVIRDLFYEEEDE